MFRIMEKTSERVNRELANLKFVLANGGFPGITPEQGVELSAIIDEAVNGDMSNPDVFNKWCYLVGRLFIGMAPRWEPAVFQLARFCMVAGWVALPNHIKNPQK